MNVKDCCKEKLPLCPYRVIQLVSLQKQPSLHCLLLPQVVFRETPLETAVKDDFYCGLLIGAFDFLMTKSEYLLFWFYQAWPWSFGNTLDCLYS